jgi:hypothetical protein
VQRGGLIPSAKNIPCPLSSFRWLSAFIYFPLLVGLITKAFGMDEETFEIHFGLRKPAFDDLIVFYCRVQIGISYCFTGELLSLYPQSGRRSDTAGQLVMQMGWTNVKNYKGSALDWFSHRDHEGAVRHDD